MDLIFNDCSLDGQYPTIQDFLECLRKNIIPCLEIAKRKKIPLFKSCETYSRKVSPDKTLHDLLNIRGNAVLVKFKSQIVSLQTEPYWNETLKNPNCFFEALSRKSPVLSFVPSRYEQKNIAVKINGEEKTIVNAFDKSSFIEALSVFSVINLSNSFSILGFPRYEYEIRIKEPSNHIPHFHVLVDKRSSASVSLVDFKILKSELSQKKWVEVFSEAISLIEQNKEDYLDIWFYYHPKSCD